MSNSEIIMERIEKHLSEKRSVRRDHTIHASSIGDKCLRRIVLRRTRGEDEDAPGIGLLAVFREGQEHEKQVRRLLEDVGVNVIGVQQTKFWPEFNLSGSIDGIVEIDGERSILEIKTISTYLYDSVKTCDDLRSHPRWYIQGWYAQEQIYMLLEGVPTGIMVLKNRNDGQIRILDLELDYEFTEGLLQKAKLVEEHVSAGSLPDFLDWSSGLCEWCRFRPHVCNPPQLRDPVHLFDDEEESAEIAADIDRLHELKPLKKEYEEVNDKLKARLKDVVGLCGDWQIDGKVVHVKGDPNPKPKEPYSYWKINYRRLSNEQS